MTTLFISECGRRISSPSSITYISSPYYKNNLYNNLKCVWSLVMTDITQLEVTFLRINLNNKADSCSNVIRLNNKSFCDDSQEDKVVAVNSTQHLVIEFCTGPSGKGVRFILKVEPVTRELYFRGKIIYLI